MSKVLFESIDNLLTEGTLDDVTVDDIHNLELFDKVKPKEGEVLSNFNNIHLSKLPREDLKSWHVTKSWLIVNQIEEYIGSSSDYSNDSPEIRKPEYFMDWLNNAGSHYLSESLLDPSSSLVESGNTNYKLINEILWGEMKKTSLHITRMSKEKSSIYRQLGFEFSVPEGYAEFVDFLINHHIDVPDRVTNSQLDSFITHYSRRGGFLDEFGLKDLEELDVYESIRRNVDKKRLDDIKSELRNAIHRRGQVKVYRALVVDTDKSGYLESYNNWLEHLADSGKSLGIFWTDNKSKAKPYWTSAAGDFALIEAVAPSKGVDWVSSAALRMNPATEGEEEIRMHKGAPMEIQRIWIEDEEVDLPDSVRRKRFRA